MIYAPETQIGSMESPVELHHGDTVKFNSKLENKDDKEHWLGIPMFTLCARYIRGKAHKFYITTSQQRPARFFYVDLSYGPDSIFMDYATSPPPSSFMGWCKQHKCLWVRVWCPEDTTQFTVRKYGIFTLEWK